MRARLLDIYSLAIPFAAGLLLAAVLLFNIAHFELYVRVWSSVAAHFVLPGIVAAGLFTAARWSRVTRLMVANGLLSAIGALYAGECYLAWRLDDMQRTAAVATGAVVDGRSKRQVIDDLRNRGIRAYPIMRAENMLLPDGLGQLQPVLTSGGRPLLPMASIPDTTVVSCNETGQWQVYKSDRHGFNNPDQAWDVSKPTIGMIGDSFTHGSCVGAGQDMASLLRKRFGSVLNLGVGGFGPLLELAALTEYLQPLQPRIVLWVFFEGNDLSEDLPSETRAPMLDVYLYDDDFRQDLIHRNKEIAVRMRAYLDRQMGAAMDRVDNPHEDALRFASLDRLREAVGFGPVQIGYNLGELQPELDLFAQVLRKARARVSRWGGSLYLVYLPESDRYFARLGRSRIRRSIYRGVLEIARKQDIPVIDVAQAFAHDPSPRRFFAYPGSHYNAEGYRVAAQSIADALGRDWPD